MLRTTFLALALAALLAVALAAPAGAAEPGAVADLTWGLPRKDVRRTVTLLREAGVRWVRLNVAWEGVEPWRKGAYNRGYLADVDFAVARARAAGINVLIPLADGVPYWASADPARRIEGDRRVWRSTYRPRRVADYAAFARFVVRRYARRGVHTYEVWNEPNLARFWPSGPNPAQYVRLRRAGSGAIRRADRRARVLLAGLSPEGAAGFLKGVYDAGGRRLFDSAAVHLYPVGDPTRCGSGPDGRPANATACVLDDFRNVMVANRDARKDVWVTEYGYSTCSRQDPSCYAAGVSEAAQSRYLVALAQRLDSPTYRYVTASFLYQLRDWAPSWAAWERNLGVVREDFTLKPAYRALAAYNLRGRAGLGAEHRSVGMGPGG